LLEENLWEFIRNNWYESEKHEIFRTSGFLIKKRLFGEISSMSMSMSMSISTSDNLPWFTMSGGFSKKNLHIFEKMICLWK
jgi:hypothetical protein